MSEADPVIEALTQRLDELSDLMERSLKQDAGHHQTIIHRTEGVGNWGVAAIVACFSTWLALILIMMDIHDLRAWKDIHAQHIGKLEAAKENAK